MCKAATFSPIEGARESVPAIPVEATLYKPELYRDQYHLKVSNLVTPKTALNPKPKP